MHSKNTNNTRTIFIVRHGENPANLNRFLSSKIIDYPLTPKGRWQAMQTAKFFLTKEIGVIYSSPLKRAVETARIMAEVLGQEVFLLDEFRELDVGILEEDPANPHNWKVHDEILRNWKSGDGTLHFPGGESYFTAVARMKRGIRRVLSDTKSINIVIVTHGGIVNSAIASICQVPADSLLGDFENCSIITVVFDSQIPNSSGKLQDWAYNGHLMS
jgi:broad specificity phosphatase PhoE